MSSGTRAASTSHVAPPSRLAHTVFVTAATLSALVGCGLLMVRFTHPLVSSHLPAATGAKGIAYSTWNAASATFDHSPALDLARNATRQRLPFGSGVANCSLASAVSLVWVSTRFPLVSYSLPSAATCVAPEVVIKRQVRFRREVLTMGAPSTANPNSTLGGVSTLMLATSDQADAPGSSPGLNKPHVRTCHSQRPTASKGNMVVWALLTVTVSQLVPPIAL